MAIESIQSQTYSNWELIICDDASTDDTFEIIKHYEEADSRIKVIRNDSNLGASLSRNRCIDSSSGDYIAIQDADDVSLPERLELLSRALEMGHFDFVSCAHYLFDDLGVYSIYNPTEEYPTKHSFLKGMPFCHAATLFTKECLTSVNGYRVDKDTIRNEDYDLFMRLYANGFRGCNIMDILYGYRVDKAALKRRSFKYRVDECIVRIKGFKELNILFPYGWIYVLKPILAYCYQRLFMQKHESERILNESHLPWNSSE